MHSLIIFLEGVQDPRALRGVRHRLIDILVISVLAVICGANTFATFQNSLVIPPLSC